MGLFYGSSTMIEIRQSEIKLYEARLNQLNKKGLKIARNESLNDTAFEARRVAKEKIEQDFTIRNTYTLRPSNNPITKAFRDRNFAEFGTKLETMKRQEEGYTQQPVKGFGVSTPTAAASNEVKGVAPESAKRNKRVAPSMRRGKLRGRVVTKRYNNLPAKQRTMALVKESFKTKKKFIVLGRNNRNMFRVSGSAPTYGKNNRFKLDRIYHISNKAKIHSAKPWLKPASEEANKRTPEFYRDRMEYQFKRIMLG